MTSYAIIANCNFESREDSTAKAIHAARKAVESGLTENAELVEALDTLEETLEEFADNGHVHAIEACREAEEAVEAAWTEEVQAEVEAERKSRYID